MALLKRLVIHCTATPEGREVQGSAIRRYHCGPKSEGGHGWSQVGYADLIHLDGRIENLVPYDEDQEVQPSEITNGAAGWNGTSRHVCYVGGRAADGRTPKDTRTAAQRRALRAYVARFVRLHPGCEVVGHRDLPGVNKACPAFDVATEL